jgi:hypothetical protein
MLQALDGTEQKIQEQWLKFMLERVGHNNLPRLLEYYESIGWISVDVVDGLLSLSENQKVKYDGPAWTLSPEEHRTSFIFIEKLLGRQVDISIHTIHSAQTGTIVPQEIRDKPRESYLKAYQLEKEDMEFTIKRREVTIDNLEQELEKKDMEIIELKERSVELERLYKECQMELRKNKVYCEILEENIRLRSAGSSGKNK